MFVDMIDEAVLAMLFIVTEETLVEFANAVMRTKVISHAGKNPNVLFTMLASSAFGIL